MTIKKKLIVSILFLAGITILVSGILLWKWNTFEPIALEIYDTSITAEKEEEAIDTWVTSYMEQYEGIFVPYSYRISNLNIESIEKLKEPGFYQVDFTFDTATDTTLISDMLRTSAIEPKTLQVQLAIKLVQDGSIYEITEIMSPVQYQIAYELEKTEPQSPQYTIGDQEMAYVFQKEQLQVTYDYGKTYVDVPIAYEDITRGNVSYDLNYLQDGSYIITPEYTAFLYTGANRSLNVIYSLDQGASWQESKIASQLSQRVKFISKTENYVYVVSATDKAMSAEGHALFRSSNFSDFEDVAFQEPQTRLMTYATFVQDGIGYVSYTKQHREDLSMEDVAVLYRTEDGGNSFMEIQLPIHEVTVLDYTYAPFIQVDQIYEEDGEIHVLVGQGDSGDYGTTTGLYMGHYKSSDGIHFTFVEEVLPERNLAG